MDSKGHWVFPPCSA